MRALGARGGGPLLCELHRAGGALAGVLEVAAVWEAWVYKPNVIEHDGDAERVPPDRDERIQRQVVLAAATDFLTARSAATEETVITIARDWLAREPDAPPISEPIRTPRAGCVMSAQSISGNTCRGLSLARRPAGVRSQRLGLCRQSADGLAAELGSSTAACSSIGSPA